MARDRWLAGMLLAASLVLIMAGCRGKEPASESKLSGTIKIDGSSTVYPITEAVAEEFGKINPSARITVGISGTGGGFQKFGAGETDISGASRPIRDTESELARENGIDYIELPIAFDAITVVVNPKNTWASSMTVGELKKLWEPAAQGKIMKWNQVRPDWPDRPIHLFGAGVDSGTYDYFTEAVVGEEHASRGDFTSSEDDNVLVQGVTNDQYALAFFGMAYYLANQDKLKVVAIDDENDSNGEGPQLPTVENVARGDYQPLARPIFIYASRRSSERPEVEAFVEFYLTNAAETSEAVGYVPLPANIYTLAQKRFDERVVGSVFGGKGAQVGVSLEDLLERETAE